MIETPQVITRERRSIAFIHLVVPRAEIQRHMGPTLAELKSAVEEQGISITGPWFTHHRRVPGATFDFEICLPVAAAITPSGRVQAGVLGPDTAAQTVYRGGYEGLGAAWREFDRETGELGYLCSPELWETYLAGPESGADASKWRTQLERRLA